MIDDQRPTSDDCVIETKRTLVIDGFSQDDAKTMTLDEFADRYIKPAIAAWLDESINA